MKGIFSKWLGHVKHISEERITKRVYELTVKARRERGRPYTRRLDGGKRACNARLLDLRGAKVKCTDR